MPVVEPSVGDVPIIEDDLYDFTILGTEVTEKADKFSGGKKVKKLRVSMQMHGTDDGEGNELVLDPLINLKWSAGGDYPASTLYLLATAVCGPQDPDIPFNTDTLDGKKGRASVKTDKPGETWPRVKEFMAPKKNGARTTTVAPAPTTNTSAVIDDVPWEDVPAVLDENGAVDWTVFWKAIKDANISRAEVAAEVNGDIENLMQMDPALVPEFLKHLLDTHR